MPAHFVSIVSIVNHVLHAVTSETNMFADLFDPEKFEKIIETLLGE